MEHKIYKTELAGQALSIEVGKLAEQANGACTVRFGDTVVFVTATASDTPREGIDFFPLSVDFEEKMYAVGRLPGGFIKREGRPTEKAILTSRLIDRPLRPLFPEGFRNDVVVIAAPHSIDPEYPPEVFAMIGSSVALSISDIPFSGPTGAVAVGMIDGEYIINPNSKQREESKLDLIVSGTKDAIMMVEAGCSELTEQEMLEAIMFAHDYIKDLVSFQKKIIQEVGKAKMDYISFVPEADLEKQVREYATEKLQEAVQASEKQVREENMKTATERILEHFSEIFPEREKEIDELINNITKEIVRNLILNEGIRPDGRTKTEIRPLSSEVGLLPRVHGSGLFKRGQTQVLTVCTLGSIGDVQVLDGLWEDEYKRYIHHYNFPQYSVGEARTSRGPGRREIGHGFLAERALEPMIPSPEDFPYTLRLVSEVMSSNGSSSMASVCGSTLALMDAGVPVKAPVAGVAMGLIKNEDSDKVAILTDIQGLEDHMGDMDFKVAGTDKGITAIQMDIKIDGIGREILAEALEQARIGRLRILDSMLEVIDKPRENLSPYAPKIINFNIHPDKIRDVIGAGGKVINKIIAETGVKIDIEDDGRVFISSPNQEAAEKALKIIIGITKDVEAGEVYTGKVVRIMNFGAFVEILPGKEGLVHISKLAHHRVEKVEDVVKVGDEIEVKVTEIDSQGRINLSHKDTLPPPERTTRENTRRSSGNQRSH
ncbi:MAG TPA: polyribonucleotide nucleotidyltransferase [Clostridiales bacterium]|nr:polyribonucleotide nucleotidyltransferase [Clostridia bacterium]HCS75760.1 polyribonucleotide nucleotidyltransferase [Clostridiales bacterium]